MKQGFKKWLSIHKGKVLDVKMIEIISQYHEEDIFSIICNEGLVFQSIETGKMVAVNDIGSKDYHVWCVKNYEWKIEREFITLRGAITYANK